MKWFKLYFWVVMVAAAGCGPKAIDTSPVLIEGIVLENTKVINYQSNVEKGTIVITVPSMVDIRKIKPSLKLSEGATVVPASGVEQDFTRAIAYTLTGRGGNKAVYIVSVVNEPLPPPTITSIDKDTLEAGQALTVSGKGFGKFDLDIKANMVAANGQLISVIHSLKDSSNLVLSLPFSLNPGKYKISITYKNQVGVSDKWVTVQYPTPQITELSHQNMLQGDTVFVMGNYINPLLYKYEIVLYNRQLSKILAQKLL